MNMTSTIESITDIEEACADHFIFMEMYESDHHAMAILKQQISTEETPEIREDRERRVEDYQERLDRSIKNFCDNIYRVISIGQRHSVGTDALDALARRLNDVRPYGARNEPPDDVMLDAAADACNAVLHAAKIASAKSIHESVLPECITNDPDFEAILGVTPSAIPAAETSEKVDSNDAQDEIPRLNNICEFLILAASKLCATDFCSRKTATELVECGIAKEAEPNSYKKQFADLVRLKLLESIRRRGGGYFLTELGRRTAAHYCKNNKSESTNTVTPPRAHG